MKHILTSAIIVTFAASAAHGAMPYYYASGITAHNITAIQHSVALNAMHNFEGTAAAALGLRAKIHMPNITEIFESDDDTPAKTTARPDIYGKMPMYGEYGDDGTVFGRNGGDIYALPTMNSVWIDWQHSDDDVKFKHLSKMDSNYDLIMVGTAAGRAMSTYGISEWGMFAGYAGASQDNRYLDITEHGGYFGLYTGYAMQNLNLSLVMDAGALTNRAEYINMSDEYANIWVGVAGHATYNMEISRHFTLQAGVYGGYTWIQSPSYTADLGTHITNKNFNMFEVDPELRAIAHVANGWFATAEARYAFNFSRGGRTAVDGIHVRDLDTGNYVEYGIGLEKSANRFNVGIHIGRHDGDRSGWLGGLNMKYMF